jgi:predicted nucleic acid-binding protein
MRIYLDNCCFNRPFDDQTQIKIRLETEAKLFIQKEILNGKYDLVWSYILEYENQMNPFKERKEVISEWKSIAVVDLEETNDILNFAEVLEDKGIKTKDALHISCAVEARCHYFLTTDKKLLNSKFEEIKIINPIEFINEMEG